LIVGKFHQRGSLVERFDHRTYLAARKPFHRRVSKQCDNVENGG
jgi:hypothetical protein